MRLKTSSSALSIFAIAVLICFDLSIIFADFIYFQDALAQDTARQTATVDHADMRGLVTYLTSLHRGTGLSLLSGIINPNSSGGIFDG